ncbi:hypothetical protein [Butyrivibrio sp. VCB2006]|uniref:hypothetical protein n=1 Tax=Butyrivibrio sp. VCB2006 TaxID=1280679 RepID=UPI0003FD2800|nr:hypothetical protein [Butyrivibrio sp. VCB2006]
MGETFSTLIDLLIVGGIILAVVKANKKKQKNGATIAANAPKKYDTYRNKKYDTFNKKPGKYDTFNKKSIFNTSGAQPHVHETRKYTSMSDASKLPPGYILLNGEPVRVADLEGK